MKEMHLVCVTSAKYERTLLVLLQKGVGTCIERTEWYCRKLPRAVLKFHSLFLYQGPMLLLHQSVFYPLVIYEDWGAKEQNT